jgi:hypothetical protein
MWPHTRNWTLHDSRLNLTLHFLHSGALFLRDHMGLQTLTHPAFAPDLDRLGLSPASPADRRPDIAVFGTVFHDDTELGGLCGDRPKQQECECAAQPMGDPTSKHFPNNLTWPERLQRYRWHAAGAAKLLTGLQAAGTRVVHLSLFPRSAGVEEFIRAAADDILYTELKTAGFLAAGGRYIDQWPIHAGYFELRRANKAEWGPSSLHYSQLSNQGHMMTQDLTLTRLTLLLNSWCNPAAEASSPCGVGSHFLPLAAYARSLNATCSCGGFGMSVQKPRLCRSKEVTSPEANGTRSHLASRLHTVLPYGKWRDVPAASDGGAVESLSPSQRADAILTNAVLDPEWPGREATVIASRPYFVLEGGISPEPYRAEAEAVTVGTGTSPAAACST